MFRKLTTYHCGIHLYNEIIQYANSNFEMRIILFANFEIRKEVILVQTSADEVFCLSSLSQFCLFGKLF